MKTAKLLTVVLALCVATAVHSAMLPKLKPARLRNWSNDFAIFIQFHRFTKMAILDFPGCMIIAKSEGFEITQEEATYICALYSNPSMVFQKGFNVAGVKYTGVKAEPFSIYGSKGLNGVFTVKTNQVIVVGYSPVDNDIDGMAASTIEVFGAYLRGNGF